MVRYNFNKSPEDAEKEQAIVPIGDYPARLLKAELKHSQTGNDMWDCRFELMEGDFQGREISGRIVFTPKTERSVYRFFNAFGSYLGEKIHEKLANLDTDGSQDLLTGRAAIIRVVHEEWTDRNGNPRVSAKADTWGFRPLSGPGPLGLGEENAPTKSGGGSGGAPKGAQKTGPAAIAEVDYGDIPF